MKKTIATAAAVLVLAGCARNSEPVPVPVPTPTATAPTIPTTPPAPTSAPPTSVVPTKPTQGGSGGDTDPTNTPSTPPPTTGADTPANAFAKRWGERYPKVPEYAVLKAANGVCKLVENSPDWVSDADTVAAVKTVVGLAGIDDNDAVEFGQDAQQNYCASA